jgi:hypothetical protein
MHNRLVLHYKPLVNPNIILAKIQQLSWWTRSHKALAYQDNCCESHQFNPGIYNEGEFATNNIEAQEIAALSLHLLQISLVFMNTLLIQRVLADPKQFQKMKQEDWRALTPLIYRHVNPYGMFRLDMHERMHIEDAEVSA